LIVLTTLTLARSNSALRDDDDCTKNMSKFFDINFRTLLKQISCAPVGEKIFVKGDNVWSLKV
jgi:hypothetical protein